MTKFPSQEAVVKAVLGGIAKAKENFLFWTNNRLFLSYAPAKIITLHVAQALGEIEDTPEVFIDATVADILRCSLPDRTSYLSYMQAHGLKQGSFNITLDERFAHESDNDSISKVVISLYNGVRTLKHEYDEEIRRIAKMLGGEGKSTLEYGMFAFYADLSCDARKKLVARIPKIIARFDEVLSEFPALKGHYVGLPVTELQGLGEWSGGCYIVEPARS